VLFKVAFISSESTGGRFSKQCSFIEAYRSLKL
jgi:hypothetical protein